MRRRSRPLKQPVQLPGDGALEAAADFAVAFALGGAARHIPYGGLVVALAEHDDGVQRPVELAVPPRFSRWRHTVVVARLRDEPATCAYAARRGQQGKSSREIRRRLKRAVARQLFKLLERYDRGQVEILRAA